MPKQNSSQRRWPRLIILTFIFSLMSFYYRTLSHHIIKPTPLPSVEIIASSSESDDSIPSASMFDTPTLSNFDLGISTFIDASGSTIEYPVQGTIGVPTSRSSSFPVVFILPGYKEGIGESTPRLDIGFTYLVQELASSGYLAISLNIPPSYIIGENYNLISDRIVQVFNVHLNYLSRAISGEDVGYGIDLTSLGDLSKTSLISHSFDSNIIYDLANKYNHSKSFNLSSLLFIAPGYLPNSMVSFLDVPTSIVLPQYDGTVASLDGQFLYDTLANTSEHNSTTQLIYLYGANHNYFNSLTEMDDAQILSQTKELINRLSSHDQRDFLAKYSVAFLNSIIKNSTYEAPLQADTAAPTTLYGYKVLTSLNAPSQLTILSPTGVYSENFNALGGDIKLKNASLTYVVDSYIPTKDTAGAFFLPGNPLEASLLRLSWNVPSATLSTTLPLNKRDISSYDALSLTIGVDPTNSLNPSDTPQSFIIELKDATGKAQRVLIDPSAPAMHYQSGSIITNNFTSYWSDFTPLSSLRVPLNLFNRVDLSRIYSISLVLNQTKSGSLMLSNMSFISESPLE